MENQIIKITDIESLWYYVSETVFQLLMNGMMLDEDGNYVGSPDDAKEFIDTVQSNPVFKYLDFRNCAELREISLPDACDLSVKEIKEKYLKDTLPLALKVMRRNSLLILYGEQLDDAIPDEYLEALFCLAWKMDLKIWAAQWDNHKNTEEADPENREEPIRGEKANGNEEL